MSSTDSTAPETGERPRVDRIWVAPVALLFGLWLWLAFSSGGYIAGQWLPSSLALGLFGLVVALLVAYPRRPRQLSMVLLGLFACYSLWVALSAFWAASTTRVWMESGRTFSYLLVFTLALMYLTAPAARRAFRYLLVAACFLILALCVWKLWSADIVTTLFSYNRFYYPVRYPNNAGALFLVGFWPLLWLAAGPEERAPVRGVALGIATGLLGLAILTQSRGALWSLALSVVFVFVISPARMRTFVYLLVPALLMAYEFPTLNRYWLEGPEAVGGAVGARTLTVAVVTAAFIGMILALLEKWIKVGRRTKTIIGAITLVAVVAGSVYGSFALTKDVGGPFKWTSQTWRQFTGQDAPESESAGDSRFTYLSSSGRVDIWRVAWESFEETPWLGVGADNFVFQYDRLRSIETMKPRQAHSLGLQVLGETGLVGGVFVFGGILLALGGILWPRCTAGWLGARATWLRRRTKDTEPKQSGGLTQAGAPPQNEAEALAQGGVATRWCNPRWGDRPLVYGWEMALLSGITYWFIHANVDWLWQMPGVSIPALLFLAAAVASVSARVDVLWPRVNRWLRIGATPASRGPITEEPSETTGQAKLTYRQRRAIRRRRSLERMLPPGVLSPVFKALLVTLSLIVIIAAGLPYLSLQFQESAVALARSDEVRAIERLERIRYLQPSDTAPYVTQAGIYGRAASAAAASEASDRAGAVLDNLALRVERFEQAIAWESADWTLHYRAGVAAINFLLARDYVADLDPGLDYAVLIPQVLGLQDWSNLAGLGEALPAPGAATNSLAAGQSTKDISAFYRNLSRQELVLLATGLLNAAGERNPLAPQVQEALRLLKDIA